MHPCDLSLDSDWGSEDGVVYKRRGEFGEPDVTGLGGPGEGVGSRVV